MHEFGHALACRQVGGQANEIILWPLGGVAYVAPPQRPGAVLWSIVAGPLVNVALAPVLTMAWFHVKAAGWDDTMTNVYTYVWAVCMINWGLLIFNLLPIYPLDGGQILRALLWFLVGRGRSLKIATGLGFVGLAGLAAFAIYTSNNWLIILCVFAASSCWQGWQHAQALARIEEAPRRPGFACPSCKIAPPVGPLWGCGRCRRPFDTFETRGLCPHCGAQYDVTLCFHCGNPNPINSWVVSPSSIPPKLF
jgi:hypothetical protein